VKGQKTGADGGWIGILETITSNLFKGGCDDYLGESSALVWDLLIYNGMSTITYKATKNGGVGYVSASLISSSHRQAKGANTWGLVIAGALLLATATFICLLLLTA